MGAALAHGLFSSIGVASYLVLAGSALVGLALIRRRPLADPGLLAVGSALVVGVAAALAQRYGPARPGLPPVGAGGYLGAAAVAFLEGQFNLAGCS